MGLAEEELQPLVYAWRNSNPAITMLWWDIDNCVKETVKKRITTETHGIRFMYESGEMVIIPEQAEVVKEIFAGCLAGKSTHIIAKELNEKGVPTKKGAKWTGGTINGILTNEKYIGDALFQKTITDASFKRKETMAKKNSTTVKIIMSLSLTEKPLRKLRKQLGSEDLKKETAPKIHQSIRTDMPCPVK